MQDPPRTLVSDGQMPLHLLGRDAALGIGKYKKGMEPQDERSRRFFEDRADRRSDLKAASAASEFLPSRAERIHAAARAPAVMKRIEYEFKAGLVSGEIAVKLTNPVFGMSGHSHSLTANWAVRGYL